MISEGLLSVLCYLKSLNTLHYNNLQSHIVTSDNQFGFKKGVGCSHAIYTVRNSVDYWVSKLC